MLTMRTRASIVESFKTQGFDAECLALVTGDMREAQILAGVINALGYVDVASVKLKDNVMEDVAVSSFAPEQEQNLVFALEKGGVQEGPAAAVAYWPERSRLVVRFVLAKVEAKKAEQQPPAPPQA